MIENETSFVACQGDLQQGRLRSNTFRVVLDQQQEISE